MADRRLWYLNDPTTHPIGMWRVALCRALARAGVPGIGHQRWKPFRMCARTLGRMRVQRNLMRLPGRAYLVGLNWPNDGRFFPYNLLWEVIPYVWDIWPPEYAQWESLVRRNRIRLAFVAARQPADWLRQRVPGLQTYWIPEGCDPVEEFRSERPLAERDIDVLELGRKLEQLHDRIAGPLAERGHRHLFSADGHRSLIFPDQASLREGLGDTKIAVSFPKSMTHPESQGIMFSGGLEVVTLRYFEQMASKCLVYGHCPAELQEMFGYNPVIQADLDDPVGQIESILSSIGDYQELVDRNYQRVREVATWDRRVETMLSVLRSHGYAPASAPDAEAEMSRG